MRFPYCKQFIYSPNERKCLECKFSYNELTLPEHSDYSFIDYGLNFSKCINNSLYTHNCAEYEELPNQQKCIRCHSLEDVPDTVDGKFKYKYGINTANQC